MLKPYFHKTLIEAGCDEAGRGCLAGPVFAAAVILPKTFKNNLLTDSKQLTDAQRYVLRPLIEKEALAFAVAQVNNLEIDEIKPGAFLGCGLRDTRLGKICALGNCARV